MAKLFVLALTVAISSAASSVALGVALGADAPVLSQLLEDNLGTHEGFSYHGSAAAPCNITIEKDERGFYSAISWSGGYYSRALNFRRAFGRQEVEAKVPTGSFRFLTTSGAYGWLRFREGRISSVAAQDRYYYSECLLDGR